MPNLDCPRPRNLALPVAKWRSVEALPLTAGRCQTPGMATGKKDGDREATIEAIRKATWKAGQTLPKLLQETALIL
jgi:hypothetical protein